MKILVLNNLKYIVSWENIKYQPKLNIVVLVY